MRRSKLFLAFGFGCLTAISLGFAADATAKRAGGISELERRVLEMEKAANRPPGQKLSQKVVAPFFVRDRSGDRVVFSVSETGATFTGLAGKLRAEMGIGENGGFLSAYSPNSTINFGVGSKTAGLVIMEDDVTRVSLGKDLAQGNYRLKFFSASKTDVAAIGETTEHLGAAGIFDKSGALKARMALSADGKGLVDVLGGKQISIAQLTESKSGGGKLWLGNASGAGMVEAGDAGGYGIVKAGPKGFNPAAGSVGLGLPGSVIAGKR